MGELESRTGDRAGESGRETMSWGAFWRQGGLTSLPDAFSGTYDDAIAAFWSEQFEPLPEGARILDIATGNGAIAALAREHSERHGKRFEIHGVDVAETDPRECLREELKPLVEGVRFHPGVAAEATGFEAGSFDMVCGQYALEYADRDGAVSECGRLLCPGGRAAFVMHHRESFVLRSASSEYAILEMFIRPGGFLECLARIIEYVVPRQGQTDLARDPKAERLRHDLNAVAQSIERRIGDDVPGTRSARYGMARGAEIYNEARPKGVEWARTRLGGLREEFNQQVIRLQDLLDAATDDRALEALTEAFAEAGVSVRDAGWIVVDGRRLGRAVVGGRAE